MLKSSRLDFNNDMSCAHRRQVHAAGNESNSFKRRECNRCSASGSPAFALGDIAIVYAELLATTRHFSGECSNELMTWFENLLDYKESETTKRN